MAALVFTSLVSLFVGYYLEENLDSKYRLGPPTRTRVSVHPDRSHDVPVYWSGSESGLSLGEFDRR